MFIGHFAAGLAAKRAAPGGSLTAYCAAAQLPDLLWPVFLLAGVERVSIAPGDTAFTPLRFDSYPFSHSLALDLVWAVALAACVWWRVRSRGPALLAGALVLSHWLLDFASHRPDMPLWPGGPLLGLGLWNSVAGTLVVETLMFGIGLRLYTRATEARGRAGRISLAVLVAVLLLSYFSSAFGPPPPNVTAIALAGTAGFAILLALAAWVDRTRSPAG